MHGKTILGKGGATQHYSLLIVNSLYEVISKENGGLIVKYRVPRRHDYHSSAKFCRLSTRWILTTKTGPLWLKGTIEHDPSYDDNLPTCSSLMSYHPLSALHPDGGTCTLWYALAIMSK